MALYQKRIVQVATNDTLFAFYHVFEAVHDVDASATGRSAWLADPVVKAERPYTAGLDLAITHDNLVSDNLVLFVKVLDELGPLVGQAKGVWDEVEVLTRVAVLHAPHIHSQPVLAC